MGRAFLLAIVAFAFFTSIWAHLLFAVIFDRGPKA